jgi:hypothetical protein
MPQYGFGAGVLSGTRNDIANGSPIRFGALQDVNVDWAGQIKELYGSNQYALDAARGKVNITGKAKFAQISAAAMATLFFGTAATVGSTLSAYNETATASAVVTANASAITAAGSAVLTFASVPAGVVTGASVINVTTGSVIPAGSYVLSKTSTTVTISANVTGGGVAVANVINFGPSFTVANSANYTGDTGLIYAAGANAGNSLAYVTSNPSVGQYTEINGVYSVNSAEAAQTYLVNYIYTSASSGYTILGGNPLMGSTPKFQATLSQQYGAGGYSTLTLYSCVANKLTFPTKLDDYVILEFDFMAFANAAGQTFSFSTSGG